MLDKIQVLDFVKKNGPVIPRDIMKVMGHDTFIIGAVLSQLKDSRQIKVSFAKIGGSPVYYVPGQENRLKPLLYKHLHEKEQKAITLLEEKKILRDRNLEPVFRVAMRNTRDFSKALEVTLMGEKEIFWKWHLFSNTEAESIIRDILKQTQEERQKNTYNNETQDFLKKQSKGNEPVKEKEYQEENNDNHFRKIEKTRDEEEKKILVSKNHVSESAEKKTKDEVTNDKLKSPDLDNKRNIINDDKDDEDDFLDLVIAYFKRKKIILIEKEMIKKKYEYDMIVNIPSAVGDLKFFCKAKKKKRCNDSDLSSAYVAGEIKKYPILFLSTGDLSKKAGEMLGKEFRNIVYIKI